MNSQILEQSNQNDDQIKMMHQEFGKVDSRKECDTLSTEITFSI